MSRAGGPTILRLAVRECQARRASLWLTVVTVAAGVAVWVALLSSMHRYDRATEAVLRAQETAMAAGLHDYDQALTAAMRRLGFNLLLLPGEQSLGDFYEQGYASATLPEKLAATLAGARSVTVAQVVPVLRRKVRWEEHGWTVLVQAFGATTPCGGAPDDAAPEVVPVPPGVIDVGYELQRGLKLQPGARVQFLGGEFQVRACRAESGTQADITVWMNLPEAQERLGLRGRVSEIQALACRAGWNQLSRVREELATVLPGVTVVEKSGETLTLAAAREAFERGQQDLLEQMRTTRAGQRRARLRLALAAGALALGLAGLVSGVAGWSNVRERRTEIGLWAALGVSPMRLLRLFSWRALLAGLAGGLLGVALGFPWWGWPGCRLLAHFALLGLAVAWVAVVPAVVVAAVLTLRLDPADVLKNEV